MLKRTFLASMLGAGLAVFLASSVFAGPAARAEAGDVIMYGTKSCGYCARARSYFNERGVAFEERDIETSATAHAEWQSLGGVGTPLIVIHGERFHGFDPRRLDAALAKSGG
jgi:glutaredoxin